MGMWLYSFCDILNYIFTQIFIIDIQKRMIMQQTLFIVILAVVIAFVLAYRWKKKAENKMDNMSLNYKSKQQIFFLTKADIVKMMSMVEIRIPIKYTLIGAFKQETIKSENTISNFSKLGHTGYANWISLDNRYMVLPLNNEVKYQPYIFYLLFPIIKLHNVTAVKLMRVK